MVADSLSRVPSLKSDDNIENVKSIKPEYLYASLDHLSDDLRQYWPLLYLSEGEEKVKDKELKQLLLKEKSNFKIVNNIVYRP